MNIAQFFIERRVITLVLTVVLLGAGEMGGGMASAVSGIVASEVSVVSRTWDRAAGLAITMPFGRN